MTGTELALVVLAVWAPLAAVLALVIGAAIRLADHRTRQELDTVTVSSDRWTCPACGGTVHTSSTRALRAAQRRPCPHGAQVSTTGHRVAEEPTA